MNAPRAIGLAGPTAAGKSALALQLAARWPAEIVSVDSALVYRGLDIGTAKPSPAQRAQVPHHLIDIIDPAQRYSAAQFAVDAKRLIGEINARGKLALLVGGTMLYFKALIEGIDTLPPADAALRADIEARAARAGWPVLHAELAQVDPETAARLAPHDAQRIQRALEVWRLTGRPLSTLLGRGGSGLPMPLIALEPQSRAWLHRRIEQRFDAMLRAGLVDEVLRLRSRGDLHPGLPALRCVGYRQVWAALDSGDLEPLRSRAIAASRQLAKRQLTWLRAMQRDVIACDADDAGQRLQARVQALLG
jgi:tRNA dimethylallyltransferase